MSDGKTIAGSAVAVLGPWAFSYLAPCGCMSGCSPANTPNRCQEKR